MAKFYPQTLNQIYEFTAEVCFTSEEIVKASRLTKDVSKAQLMWQKNKLVLKLPG